MTSEPQRSSMAPDTRLPVPTSRTSRSQEAPVADVEVRSLRRHINGLDGIRALAAGLVLVYHFHSMAPIALPQPLNLIVSTGWAGVDIFFTISGFILFLPWARAAYSGATVNYRTYLRNRALRIVPAYWLSLFVLVTVVTPTLLLKASGWRIIILNATFLNEHLPASVTARINPVSWTLVIEVGFYLLLPIVARFFVRNRWLVSLPITLVISFGLKYFFAQHSVGWITSILCTFDQFAMGMVTAAVWARLESRNRNLRPGVGLSMSICGLVGVWGTLAVLVYGVGSAAYWNGSGPYGWWPLFVLRPLVSAFAAILIFGSCYQTNLATRFFQLRPIAFFGVISYGVYLWHYEVGHLLALAMPKGTGFNREFAMLMIIGTAVSIMWALVSHHFVEKPFLQRKLRASPYGEEPRAT